MKTLAPPRWGPPDKLTRRRHRRTGFTLIELLVVIAIIGILASILFPVFARVRGNALRSSCQSNLKQIGLGMQQYLQDYDERYLPPQLSGGNTFVSLLQPYVKSSQIFLDTAGPADNTINVAPNDAALSDFRWVVQAPNVPSTGHYGMNLQFTQTPTVLMTEVQAPTKTVIFFDCSWYEATTPTLVGSSVLDAQRHLAGENFCYADGHVKWQNLTKNLNAVSFDLFTTP